MNTILLIDDNVEILENLTEYLVIKGYTILGANNGKMGIELASTFKPDLIICDALMPEMDGHEVLRLLMENGSTHEIPFIFSTSMSEVIDRNEALQLGADDYIIKPFELENLLCMVKMWVKAGSKRLKFQHYENTKVH